MSHSAADPQTAHKLRALPDNQQLHVAGVAVAELHRARCRRLQRRVLVLWRQEVHELAAVGRLQLALRHRGGGPVASAADIWVLRGTLHSRLLGAAARSRPAVAVAAKRMLLSVQIQSTTAGLHALPMAQTYKYGAAPDSQLLPR